MDTHTHTHTGPVWLGLDGRGTRPLGARYLWRVRAVCVVIGQTIFARWRRPWRWARRKFGGGGGGRLCVRDFPHALGTGPEAARREGTDLNEKSSFPARCRSYPLTSSAATKALRTDRKEEKRQSSVTHTLTHGRTNTYTAAADFRRPRERATDVPSGGGRLCGGE